MNAEREGTGIEMLRVAVRNKQIVQFSYENADGERSTRRARPLVIWDLSDGLMFSAWCELRKGFRTFRFDRLRDFAVTSEHFQDDAQTGLQAFLAQDECD